MALEFTRAAAMELEEHLDFIAERNERAAEKLRAEIMKTLDLFDAIGFEGEAARLRTGAVVRRFYKHPFWLYFEREGEVLRVLAVRHHAQFPLSSD